MNINVEVNIPAQNFPRQNIEIVFANDPRLDWYSDEEDDSLDQIWDDLLRFNHNQEQLRQAAEEMNMARDIGQYPLAIQAINELEYIEEEDDEDDVLLEWNEEFAAIFMDHNVRAYPQRTSDMRSRS